MAVETPARIAVLGAGPIGLEAALYARFLGYDVDIYERTSLAGNVACWGHVRMFSPFGRNRSTLGLAALVAQDDRYRPPSDESFLTGRQWAERYLQPLAQTDLLADHVHQHTTVVAVSREGVLKADLPGDARRTQRLFRILLRDRDGLERASSADVVIDATGVYGNPNWMGPGGGPAIGEIALRSQIEYGLPDILDSERRKYAGRHTLLVGDGYSAATSVTALAQLGCDEPNTRVTWITRNAVRGADRGPVAEKPGDQLPERLALAQAANRCAGGASPCIVHWRGASVASIEFDADAGQYAVQFVGTHPGVHRFNRVVANVGCRPDDRIYQELQVHHNYVSDGPTQLPESLLAGVSADDPKEQPGGASFSRNPEPNFYVLGSKSLGRNSDFLVSVGLEQIRELFALLGGRRDLDLYASAKGLPM